MSICAQNVQTYFSYNHNASRYSTVKIKTSHFEDLDKI